MAVKSGYKQTELGVIPKEWELRGLLTIVRIANGQVDPRNEPFRSMTLVAPDHIESGTGKLLEKQTAADQRAISGKYLFDRGDIVYSKIRPYLRKAILTDFSGLCSADMYPLKPATDVVGGFMLPVLLAHRFTKYAESVSVRSGMPKINRAEMAEFVVALPSPPEQRAIAKALSDVDGLLDGLDRLIAKKRDLKQAVMQQLLSGKTRLPGFHGEWDIRQLKELVSLYQPQTISAAQFVEAGFPVYGANGIVGFYHSTNHDTWQVTVTCRGSTCGTVNKTVDRCWITGNAMVLNCDQRPGLSKEFLYYLMLGQELSGCITGTGQPQIVRGPLAEFSVRIPSNKSEQTAIAEVLTEMDMELAALEQRREKTRALNQAMMQELLTGSTRLV